MKINYIELVNSLNSVGYVLVQKSSVFYDMEVLKSLESDSDIDTEEYFIKYLSDIANKPIKVSHQNDNLLKITYK